MTAVEETAAAIALALGETEVAPRKTIWCSVDRLGSERTLEVLRQVQQVEASGGMMLPDGSRRRTPGGVYFRLLRDMITPQDAAYIFPYTRRKQGKKAPAQPTLPLFAWSDRRRAIEEISSQKGVATTVKITLVGRPGKVIERQELAITSMQNMKAPSLPKGLPTPPKTATDYTVYIALKQWSKVKAAMQDPADVLIVEGWAAYDPELEGIAVFATNVTTKLLQQAQRQTQ